VLVCVVVHGSVRTHARTHKHTHIIYLMYIKQHISSLAYSNG